MKDKTKEKSKKPKKNKVKPKEDPSFLDNILSSLGLKKLDDGSTVILKGSTYFPKEDSIGKQIGFFKKDGGFLKVKRRGTFKGIF